MSEEVKDRFTRQSDLVPLERLSTLRPISIIGVGALGRPLALQLAAIGAPSLKLIDHDVVDLSNITTQGYDTGDIGRPKVEALAETIKRFDPAVEVEPVCDVFRDNQKHGSVVFCCVDSISTRKRIWDRLKNRLIYWGDGRMLGETLRVLTSTSVIDADKYEKTLFDQAEAEVGRCTARSTMYASNITAGFMIHQFTRWLRDLPVTTDLLINLLADELILDCEAPDPTSQWGASEESTAELLPASSS